jgi:hypothetical protein
MRRRRLSHVQRARIGYAEIIAEKEQERAALDGAADRILRESRESEHIARVLLDGFDAA